ncbi:MAG: penicillin-binding transpeptidase domain-containing protein, partial [Castellaniella sp.]
QSAAGTPTGRYAVHGEYPAELARQLLYGVYQDDIYSRGFNIYTTINSVDQEAAYQSLRDGVLDYTRRAYYPGPEETIDLPEGIENQPEAFNEILDTVQEKYPDNGDLLTGIVLSASPTEIKVARSPKQIITITDKSALRVVARGLGPKAKDSVRISRGSVVYVHKQDNDVWELLNKPGIQAALVSVRAQDGGILAMVGGFDFEEGKFNRVTQAWRQPGSSFKPFIYASALERGLTPATQISDEPFSLTAEQTGSKAWNPKNYGRAYEPMLTMRQGLYKSKNMVSIRIMQAVGPQYVQDYVTRFGFDRSRQPAVLPLALGAGSVTPLQLAGGFAVFANGGYRVPPYLIDHVTDSSGKVIMRARPTVAGDTLARVIDPRTAYVMNDMLRGVATYGTGARVHRELKRNDIGGKTGTTNDSQDAWFAGFTPKQVAVAWMGFDQPKSMGQGETGGGAALPIWVGYMRTALKGQPEIPPGPMPSGLSRINGDFYFSEYPPGVAIARVGLPAPGDPLSGSPSDSGQDGIGALLDQLHSRSDNEAAVPQPVRVPF